uniref:Uncharacterized protein n=1 Tax=Anguilla anguilla TaxID=7936 RepID=A0A0E9SSS3_ANGAN
MAVCTELATLLPTHETVGHNFPLSNRQDQVLVESCLSLTARKRENGSGREGAQVP